MKHLISVCLAVMIAAVPMTAMAQDVESIMAQFKNEPTIEQTQQVAMEYAGLTSDRLEGMYTRSGATYALPKTISYEWTYRDQNRDQPQMVTTYANNNDQAWTQLKTTEYEQNTDYMQHKVRAQWELSRLIYNPEQLRVVSQMSSSSKVRDSLLKSVTKTYFQRRKAQIDMITNPPKDVASMLNAELKIQEFTAELDAVTGGWFSKNIH